MHNLFKFFFKWNFHDIVLEEYLIQEKNFKNRQLIATFRTSDHCLQIETGRYNNKSFELSVIFESLSIVFCM
jgi:hypothetical protein